jgi:hypothetical protein
MPQRGRKPQSCKALSKSKSTEHAVALCSECRRMRAKKPCHRVSNPQGCSCDYCGPNAPRQPTAASTPEVDVPPAPRKGRGTRRSSSHFDEHDATGSPLYTGSITDSARMELKLQQQRNLDYEQTRQDKKKPKLTCKGGAACDGDGCVDSTAEARSPSSASLESSLRMQRDLIDQLKLHKKPRTEGDVAMGMGAVGKSTQAHNITRSGGTEVLVRSRAQVTAAEDDRGRVECYDTGGWFYVGGCQSNWQASILQPQHTRPRWWNDQSTHGGGACAPV